MDFSAEKRTPLNPVLTFEQAFAHYPEILEQIYKQGFEKPSPVQVRIFLMLCLFSLISVVWTG